MANKKITKETTFAELIELGLAEKLAERGLACISCHLAQLETIEQGAISHGLDPNTLVKELNQELENESV
ncbi:MAG: DUF1858 domain-containing protein [Candidatus Nanoarchaeia archaeon]